jgi:serralysin
MCWMCASKQAFVESGGYSAPHAAAPPGISISTGIASVSSDYYWGAPTVTYSIAVAGSPWAGYTAGTNKDEPFRPEYSTFSTQQAAQFRLAIGKWDELIATSFVETSGAANTGDIRIAFSNVGTSAAYAYFPPYGGSASSLLFQGDIWFAHTSTASTMAPGSFDFRTLLHELGHSLGLNHSFQGMIPLPLNLENYRYSVMSYTSITDSTVITFSGTPASISGAFTYANFVTPALYDIAAVQQRYGADVTTRAGASIYTWGAASTTLEVIYDAGGIDTWDLSAQTRASDIDLRDGAYSSINRFTRAEQIAAAVATYGESNRGFIESYFNVIATADLYEWRDNVGIAFGTVIENVIGGSGDDTIAGNTANNNLAGCNGADSLSGLSGDDTLAGGDGNDTVTGGAGNDTFVFASGLDLVTDFTAGGTDDRIDLAAFTSLTTFSSVLSLASQVGANTVITFSAGNVLTLANVTRAALTAADFLLVGGNPNLFVGTTDNDTLTGTVGNDTLTGLDGNDTFVLTAGLDTITDFVAGGTDDRVDVSAIAGLSDMTKVQGLATQLGADTLITLAYDRTILLSNVTATALTAADFIFASAVAANPVNGTAGPDTLNGTAGADSITGGAGNDYLLGGANSDLLDGGTGNDILLADTGNDTLIGGDGTDYLYSGTGTNVLSGNAGLDILISEGTSDILNGGADQNYYYRSANGSSQSFGGEGVDILVGGTFTSNDLFYGFGGDDYALGGAGNDELIGGNGNDILIGEDGDDTLDGGLGVNYLYADGTGSDLIRVNATLGGTQTQLLVSFEGGGTNDSINISGSTLTSFAGFQALAAGLGSVIGGNILQNTNAGCVLTLNLGTANQSDIWFLGTLAGGITSADLSFG